MSVYLRFFGKILHDNCYAFSNFFLLIYFQILFLIIIFILAKVIILLKNSNLEINIGGENCDSSKISNNLKKNILIFILHCTS